MKSPEHGGIRRVLIIEDSPVVLKYLLDVFYPQWSPFSVDFHVTMTTSGGEAKRMISGEYDYILVDYDLPDYISGGEVLRYAVQGGLIRPGTTIIAISGVPNNNERLLELGAHVAVDKNSLRFYDEVKRLVS
jgi:CheY-like chemotaxis protein